jgi:hypothetical protein
VPIIFNQTPNKMKKTILIILLLICTEAYSQISLDFQSSLINMWPTKLSNTKTVYLDYNQWNMNHQNQFSLYNLDGTFYKTILMPPRPDTSSFFYFISNISESLFDNDPSTIEYIVAYTYDSIPGNYLYNRVKVIREDGTILLDEMNASQYSVYSTEEGTKLMLNYIYANGWSYQTKVFNLPGQIPTETIDKNNDFTNTPVLYPNPNAGSFFINFHSNAANNHLIELYSTTGVLINTYKSSSNLTHINNFGLSDGVYLINTRTKGQNSTTKMIIKK